MKIKMDFVTNSSSASFILYVDSTADSVNEFINDNWEKYLDYYKNEYFFEVNEKVKKYKELLEKNYKEKLKLEKKIKSGKANDKDLLWKSFYEGIQDPKTISEEKMTRDILGDMTFKKVSKHPLFQKKKKN